MREKGEKKLENWRVNLIIQSEEEGAPAPWAKTTTGDNFPSVEDGDGGDKGGDEAISTSIQKSKQRWETPKFQNQRNPNIYTLLIFAPNVVNDQTFFFFFFCKNSKRNL